MLRFRNHLILIPCHAKLALFGKIILLRLSVKEIFFCTKTHFPFKRIRVRNVYNANVQYMNFNYDTKGNTKLALQEGQRDVKIDR